MTLYIRAYVRDLPCVHRFERLPGGYRLMVLVPWTRAGICFDCGGTGTVLDITDQGVEDVPCETCQGRGKPDRAHMYVCVELETDPWGRVREWAARVWEPLHGTLPFSWDLYKLERVLNEAGVLCSALIQGIPPDPEDFPEFADLDDADGVDVDEVDENEDILNALFDFDQVDPLFREQDKEDNRDDDAESSSEENGEPRE